MNALIAEARKKYHKELIGEVKHLKELEENG